MKLKTRDIVYIGFIAALCAVATTIRIEIPGGAMVHLGSAALFTSSILFGGLYGGLGAAIGSALFDLFWWTYAIHCILFLLLKVLQVLL